MQIRKGWSKLSEGSHPLVHKGLYRMSAHNGLICLSCQLKKQSQNLESLRCTALRVKMLWRRFIHLGFQLYLSAEWHSNVIH